MGNSDNISQQIHGTACIGLLLRRPTDQQHLKTIIDTQIMSKLISFCYKTKNIKLQHVASQCIGQLYNDRNQILKGEETIDDAIKAFSYLLTTTKYIHIMKVSLCGLGIIAQKTSNQIVKNK